MHVDLKLCDFLFPYFSRWQLYVHCLSLWVYFYFVNNFICIISVSIPHINDVIQYSSSVWHISLSLTISRSIHVAAKGIISFILMTNIPLYICTTFSLSIPLLMGIYVAFMSWLLLTVLQWTLECMYPFGPFFSLGICLGVGF